MRSIAAFAAFIVFAAFAANTIAQEFRSVSAGNQIIEAEVHKPVSFKLDTAIKQDWNPSDKIQVVNNSWRHSKNLSFLSVSGIFYIWAPVGEHSLTGEMLLVNWTKQDIDQRSFELKILIRESLIPDPTPDPIPPAPITNNPFGTENKLRLLIVEEQTQRATLPPKQKEILESARVRDFLDDAGAEWRILDANTEFSNESSMWKKALKLNSTVPGIIISNGKKWQALPLPQNVEEVMKLFIEYTK